MKIDINEALDQLAKGFNVAVEELYPMLHKQAVIDGVFSLMWTVLFISLIGVFGVLIRLIIKKQKLAEKEGHGYEWDWDQPRQVIILFTGIFISIIGLFVIPISLNIAATALLNPDYYILQEILKQIK